MGVRLWLGSEEAGLVLEPGDKQFCWSQVQSIGHRAWWVCEHVLIFPNVCSCWLGF